MTQLSPFVTALVITGLSFGPLVGSSGSEGLNEKDTRAADLAGIEKLHKADVDATLTQDPAALTILWSEDGVKLDLPGQPVRGIPALKELYEKFRAGHPEFKVLKYAPVIKDVQIADGWAMEIVDFDATFKMSEKDEPMSVHERGVRVLKRQSDGSWKFAVVGLK
jgi:uncharacterized protein (TIGR02246 family)